MCCVDVVDDDEPCHAKWPRGLFVPDAHLAPLPCWEPGMSFQSGDAAFNDALVFCQEFLVLLRVRPLCQPHLWLCEAYNRDLLNLTAILSQMSRRCVDRGGMLWLAYLVAMMLMTLIMITMLQQSQSASQASQDIEACVFYDSQTGITAANNESMDAMYDSQEGLRMLRPASPQPVNAYNSTDGGGGSAAAPAEKDAKKRRILLNQVWIEHADIYATFVVNILNMSKCGASYVSQDVTDIEKMAYVNSPCECSEPCGLNCPPGSVLDRSTDLRDMSDKERHRFCYTELKTLADREQPAGDDVNSPPTYKICLK